MQAKTSDAARLFMNVLTVLAVVLCAPGAAQAPAARATPPPSAAVADPGFAAPVSPPTAALAATPAADGPQLPAIGTPTGQRHPGKLVWFDLLTLDPAAAERFYGGLLGWRFEKKGGYALASDGGAPFAGILRMPPQPGQTPQARWVPLISVADVAAAAAAVKKASGKVLEGPATLGARGRYAAVADPRGAQFVLLSSATGDPPDDGGPLVPGWVWAELWSDDPPRAAAFYKDVVGYQVSQEGSGKAATWTLASEQRPRTRIARMPFEKVAAQWLPYAAVPDLKAALARVKDLGGKVLKAPSQAVAQGALAVVSDPGGAVIVLEKRPDAPPLPPVAAAPAVGAAGAAAAASSDPYGIEEAQRKADEEAAARAAAAAQGGAAVAGGAAEAEIVYQPPAVTVVPYGGIWLAPSPWWGYWGPGWWGPGWVGAPPGWGRPPYPPPGYRPPGHYPGYPGYRPPAPGYPGYRPPAPGYRPPGQGSATRPAPPRAASPSPAPSAPRAPAAPAPAPAPRR